MAAFQSGQVDSSTVGWTNMTVRDFLKLGEENKDKLTVTPLDDYAGFGLMLNVKKPPTDDVRVRRAIFLAVDRDAITQAITAGKGQVGSPLQAWAGLGTSEKELRNLPGFRLTPDGKKDPRDLEEARKLLAEAGHPNGFDISIAFSLTEGQNPDTAAILKEQLKAVGLRVTLKGLEYQAALTAWTVQDFEMGIQGNGWVVHDPDEFLNAYYIPGGTRNYTNWGPPRFVELYEQQARATDPAERKQLIGEMERILLYKDSPAVMLYYQPFFWAWSHKIKNWGVPITVASTGMKWESAWLEE